MDPVFVLKGINLGLFELFLGFSFYFFPFLIFFFLSFAVLFGLFLLLLGLAGGCDIIQRSL